jgi:shikimate dehydrogenase
VLAAELSAEMAHDERLAGPVDRVSAIPWDDEALEEALDQIDLIVNATSAGMKRHDPPLFPERFLQPHHLVYDMIYQPARTRLLADAADAGARTANGLSMLLWQGAISFEHWFNREAPVKAMSDGLNLALTSR